ncbi:hypothetical protein NECAME_14223 [Necator americanus]|uniref:Uncharacterized protein n=1 Tax=Necator americanus TaxID=51031 RepID=W2SRC8_NECAM|nr:hypothetical protein NECAME_14223 [Necator americanus]ETN71411.1 hypothetical protein NECAME_14223 [Necator americanus]
MMHINMHICTIIHRMVPSYRTKSPAYLTSETKKEDKITPLQFMIQAAHAFIYSCDPELKYNV